MKNISKLLVAVLASASVVSCQDFLGKNSISTVDNTFVFNSYETAKTVIYGAINSVKDVYNSGLPTNFDNIGSDVERCSVGLIADLVGAAQLYGGQTAYTVENFGINGSLKGYWDTIYSAISKCNQVIYNIQAMDNYEDIITKDVPNDWSDLLGQAYTFRALMYLELVWHYGDCIYYTEDEVGQDIKDLTNRDFIMDCEIASVMAAEDLMYKVGENGHMPDQVTKNFADGLIGRMCFWEAGYQTRRTDLGDDFYTKGDGSKYTYEVWGTDASRNAVYGRRSDWKELYSQALPYLKSGITEPGEVSLTTVDPRSDGMRTFNNPFQYYFEQVTQMVMPYESIFEIAIKAEGGGSRIAYNFGRGSNGGSPAYPPKANAQTCSYPAIFYGYYDPQDLRRDATLGVTGSSGNGREMMYTYGLSNKITIGIGMNKYDPNRQINPDARQLYSGINYVVMRQADMILMYAEALAVTGNTSEAKTYLKQIHDRAFPDDVQDAKFDELMSMAGNDVYEAIIAERALEFADEDLRRWDLIRTGTLPDIAVSFREELVREIAEMKANGYVAYPNGNEYPAFVWTKYMDAKKVLGYRLTATTPSGLSEDSDEYALLFPGYRGQHDDWLAVATEDGAASKISFGNGTNDLTNLAIKGLAKRYYPTTEVTVTATADTKAGNVKKGDVLEVVTLESYDDVIGLGEDLAGWKDGEEKVSCEAVDEDGYTLTPWGILQYTDTKGALQADAVTEARWGSEFMCGYTDADYAAKKAPIYLIPMRETVCTTTGLTNGYGFKSAAN